MAEARPAQRKGAVSRRLLPYVPVALGVLAQTGIVGSGGGTAATTATAAAVAPGDIQPKTCADDIADYRECHSTYPTGCSASGKYDGYLNWLKNLDFDPQQAPAGEPLTPEDLVGKDKGLPDGLAKANHEQFRQQLETLGEGEAHVLVGVLYYAKAGGKESSNCGLQGADNIDFHIGIGPPGDLAAKIAQGEKLSTGEHHEMEATAVVVEMTPHWRAAHEPDWDLGRVQKAVGRQVRVTGQLLVDNEHDESKDDCAKTGASPSCWRASVWELHPVTRFDVCRADSCPEDGSGDDWVSLDDFAGGAAGGGTPAAAAPGAAAPPAGGAAAPAAPKT
ncbi:MAG TPA: hypothetical protein VE075_09900 [Thermoanaerobaculia bacterium]|nr:hypothetical protein [Thermoanaerobaculia bacterium]